MQLIAEVCHYVQEAPLQVAPMLLSIRPNQSDSITRFIHFLFFCVFVNHKGPRILRVEKRPPCALSVHLIVRTVANIDLVVLKLLPELIKSIPRIFAPCQMLHE